ncbi:MAG: hypothetical protein EKK37_11735 [Sphingobacteriales bacterium]|nr:MAG: hypothetical protein EKK37_11735 [Sphingobacteriales bacterium]
MKGFLIVLNFILVSSLVTAQNIYQPTPNSQERKQHLVAMHTLYDTMYYNQSVVFVIDKTNYKSNGKWAFIEFKTQQKNGKAPNFKNSAYKEDYETGIMDDNSYVLLKKVNNKWRVISNVDFPTDVPFGCWWKKYKAPKEIFFYTDGNCDVEY